jgi:hypothetical protein
MAKMAGLLHRIKFDLPLEGWLDAKPSGKAGPDASSLIKPN